MQLNANEKFCVVNHKGRWIVALTKGWDSQFKSCDTLNRTQALLLINFLAEYVYLVKPTNATTLNASIKASVNRITKASHELTGIAARAYDKAAIAKAGKFARTNFEVDGEISNGKGIKIYDTNT